MLWLAGQKKGCQTNKVGQNSDGQVLTLLFPVE